MRKVVIIVNAKVKEPGKVVAASPVTERMVSALKQAINGEAFCQNSSVIRKSAFGTEPIEQVKIEVVPAASLWSDYKKYKGDDSLIYCPLTIQLPDDFEFPGHDIYKACRDIKARRRWVKQNLGYKICSHHSQLGDFWLPVVLTAKGPIYGEMIGEGGIPNSYQQPIDLPDRQRQNLYYLAHRLLQSLSSLPGVYLLQFGFQDRDIVFDRLWPFPAAPAISSIKVQQPDLFTCHWYCLTDRPILDLTIVPNLSL
jgi:hypothetical protein